MKIDEIKRIVTSSKEYSFLTTRPALGKNIMLLGLGGSYAYGMNKDTSDIDIRGIAFNKKEEILLGQDFEQVVDNQTDTTVYSFNKIIELLTKANPNTIEILGLEPDQYLYITELGKLLIDNAEMFLSKRCIHTFGGYASSQLRRLENKAARLTSQAENERHVLKSIENARFDFERKYFDHDRDQIKLFIGDSVTDGYDTEIFMNIHLENYPLRDWANMWNEMKCIVSSYDKIGKRNEKALTHDKLGKHMAHLIRLYMMCIDILLKKEIITKRVEEHDLLMRIRNGEFLDENRQPTKDFYDILAEFDERLEDAKKKTSLPDDPDFKRINNFKKSVNEMIVKGENIYVNSR